MIKLLAIVLATFSATSILGAIFPSVDRSTLQLGEYHLRYYWIALIGIGFIFYRAVDD